MRTIRDPRLNMEKRIMIPIPRRRPVFRKSKNGARKSTSVPQMISCKREKIPKLNEVSQRIDQN